MLRIQWLAHAAFLLEGDGLRIITDPYEPNDIMNLPPITTAADIVVRSSDDDEAHAYVDSIPPGFDLVTATEIVDRGAHVRGVVFAAVWSEESHAKDVVRDNAMYRFTLEGITITHMGDVGNALDEGQLAALAGTDVLLALAGGYPTIDLGDLAQVIAALEPKVVIPMHYRIPGPRFHMLPVTEFASRFPDDRVVWVEGNHVAFSKESLPSATTIFVLEPTLFRADGE